MKIVFVTRYSYFGKSGWQSPDSKAKERLFDPARLRDRATYFENVALASLTAQSDDRFRLLVLSSEDLPDREKVRLEQLCHDTLGARAHVIYRPPGHAGMHCRWYVRNKLKGPRFTAQVVLDDDDAVSNDFVQTLRHEAQMHIPSLREDPEAYTYFSFPEGLSAVFADDEVKLYKRSVPFTNLGLTLLAPTQSRRNPFNIDHKNLARDHPTRQIYLRKPFYIRSVHAHNDSAAGFGDKSWSADDLKTLVHPRFPFLKGLMSDYKRARMTRAA